MAYDDIRISELPTLPELHNNDLFLIQDVTNGLAHNIDWNRLKNSIGTLANGIIFPLGTVEEPQIAVGDYTSGIYGDDFGTFNIATHGYKRIGITQAGTIELINGNVLVGSYDRQCEYSLIVNNTTRFNCHTVVQDDLTVGGKLDVTGDIVGGNNLEIPGDVVIGKTCSNTLTVNSELIALCNLNVKGYAKIGGDIEGAKDITVLHNAHFGSKCSDKFDVYSNAHFRCDMRVDGDLHFGGDLLLEGSDIGIGAGCDSTIIHLRGNTFVHCNLRVNGDTFLDQDVFVLGNQFLEGNFTARGDVLLGVGCSNHVTVNAGMTVECDTLLRGDVTIGDSAACPGTKLDLKGSLDTQCDILGQQDLTIVHNVEVGTDCSDDLLVHSTAVFDCDTTMKGGLDVANDVEIGGDLVVNGNSISLGEVGVPCTPYPNQINLHGEVNIDCDLNVAGDIKFEGNLGLGGDLIAFGNGCGYTDIILNGEVTNKCDTSIEGNLIVLQTSTFIQDVRMEAKLNVVDITTLDDDLVVHMGSRHNRPTTGSGGEGVPQNYWYHCCEIPADQQCALDDTLSGYVEVPITEIFGSTKAYCNVDLNDRRWWGHDGDLSDPHVQVTTVFGHFNARSNVDLNSNDRDTPDGNHEQKTNIWGQIQQYSKVELNKYINTGNGYGYNNAEHQSEPIIGFNDANNKRQTIIHGDTDIKHNVILNTYDFPNCNELTRINGKLETKCDTHLNENVQLNGGQGATGVTQCSVVTDIFGQLKQRAVVELNMDSGCCAASNQSFGSTTNNACTLIHGDIQSNGSVKLNTGCSQLTLVMGNFETKCSVKLNSGCGDNTEIRGYTNIRCDLEVDGNITGHQNLQIDGNGKINGYLEVDGNITGHQKLQIDGNGKINGTLEVDGNTQLNANLDVKGNTSLHGTLDVDGKITGKNDLQINGNTVLGTSCSSNTVELKAKTTVDQITIQGGLYAGGNSGGAGAGTAVPSEGMALTSTNANGGCSGNPSWNPVVNSISIPAGGALAESANKKTGNLELDVAVCPDGGIVVDSCGLALDDTCVPMNIITTERINNRDSGTMNRPGIIVGFNGSSALGITGSVSDQRIRFVVSSSASGGGCNVTAGSPQDLAFLDYNAQDYRNTCIGASSHSFILTYAAKQTARRVSYDDYPDIPDVPDPSQPWPTPPDFPDPSKPWPTPPAREGGGYLYDYYYDRDVVGSGVDYTKLAGNIRRLETPDRELPFDIEDIFDRLIGTDTTRGAIDGVVEWKRVSDAWCGTRLEADRANPEPFFPVLSADKLASIHPSLVRYAWTDDSFEFVHQEGDDLGSPSKMVLKPEGQRTAGITRINDKVLTILLMAAVKLLKHRKQNKLIASQLVDAVDDTAAAAAGVAINETYRNGSQLMIRVS